ncbi:hypothetical protein MTO96_047168 [Rhipicephalus appendiculatus]
MIRVGRRRKWCVIGVGVSVGENMTLSARDAARSTQADGHWNDLSEERLCNAHCYFRRTADEAVGRCVEQRWAGGTSARCTWMAPTVVHLRRVPKEKSTDLSSTYENHCVECRVGSADRFQFPRRFPRGVRLQVVIRRRLGLCQIMVRGVRGYGTTLGSRQRRSCERGGMLDRCLRGRLIISR